VAERAGALGVDAPVNRTLHALVRLREARREEEPQEGEESERQ